MPKLSLTCEHDVMCYQGTWGSESNAEARMVFTSGGSSYVCSGTLVADKDAATFIPYFVSANHCIDNQLDASSLQTYWFYRSTACNSGVRGASATVTGGATLLYASPTTDTSFMRLNSPPPAGALYAGWIVGATPDPGTAVTGIHHPSGGLQKISFGSIADYWSCSASVDEHFTCDSASGPASSFYGVDWSTGITEPGSSGSGLFRDNGHYLVGQLYGGSSSCTGSASDFYGRFDVAYNAALYQWLGNAASAAPTAPVALPALDYSDLWWNRAQSGWGLAITQHDSRLFAAWYLYDDAGNPLWAVIPGGQWSAANVFSGDLYTATGPDPTGAFDPARVVRTPVGSASITFSGAGSAVLSYRMDGVFEARSIERQPFGVPNAPASPAVGDMWWNAAESGWGISISQQFGTLFAVWYTYLPSGAPAWYVMPGGNWNAPGTYTGTLYRTQYAQRPFLGASFDPGAVTRIPVGSLSIHFMDAGSAFMTYSIGAVSGTKAITRQPF
jgi:trypsin-like peptidase